MLTYVFADALVWCGGPLRGRGGAQDASKKYARAAGALQGPATAARPGRTAGTHAPHKGVPENVRRQSRELLYSIPAALCDEIAAAASET